MRETCMFAPKTSVANIAGLICELKEEIARRHRSIWPQFGLSGKSGA